MAESNPPGGRRDFMAQVAALLALRGHSPMNAATGGTASRDAGNEFTQFQERRRRELWGLLGDLPWKHQPAPPRLIRTERHEGYTLERLVLDVNGVEPVPALLLVPNRVQHPAPGLLFIHWHAGMYDLGKEQLLKGVEVQPPYAPVCAEKGLVTLAIDSWCFGERKHEADGHQGEEDAFKLMLWRGQVLWGMMMFDELRALNYLASRPEVDATRLGAFGMSMGATKAWWLGALDPRLRVVMDVCCLTDYASLIEAHGLSEHGVYYFVPSLLKHFDTFGINELIVPRPRLSVNGRLDPLTPPAGVEKVRDQLLPLYKAHGRAEDCRIELFDCAHQELPEMRREILAWMDRTLASPRNAPDSAR
ncbi:MAG TPA: alpha/beta hydrolase family protein [Terriglobia bacterium]|nr:alpha/beta hydrolase family protein [Terriglobia bacterium]